MAILEIKKLISRVQFFTVMSNSVDWLGRLRFRDRARPEPKWPLVTRLLGEPHLPVDTAQTGLFEALPDAVAVRADLLARRYCGGFSHVDRMTKAPGTSSSSAVASTAAWSAAWSIGLSADEPLVVPPRPATICARSCSLRDGSFCWAKVETIRPMANPTASSTWSFMIYSGSSRLSSIIQVIFAGSPILLLLHLTPAPNGEMSQVGLPKEH